MTFRDEYIRLADDTASAELAKLLDNEEFFKRKLLRVKFDRNNFLRRSAK
jgi:hypothetical protein